MLTLLQRGNTGWPWSKISVDFLPSWRVISNMAKKEKNEQDEDLTSNKETKAGFFGTLRRAVRTLKLRRRRHSKPGSIFSNESTYSATEPMMNPESESRSPPVLVESFLHCRDDLLDELAESTRRLKESTAENDSLSEDLHKTGIRIYCMNSMVDHRYEWLESHRQQAKDLLRDEEAKNLDCRTKLADYLGCNIAGLQRAIHPGRDSGTQTVPDVGVTSEALQFYEPEACKMHITILKDVLWAKNAEITAKYKQLDETKYKNQMRINHLMRLRSELQLKLNTMERRQDANKRLKKETIVTDLVL